MKVLKFIGVSLLYILYFLFTLNERNKYMAGEAKGMKCTNISHGLIYTDITFSPSQKPEKNYISIKQFFQRFGFFKTQTNN